MITGKKIISSWTYFQFKLKDEDKNNFMDKDSTMKLKGG